MIHCQRCLTANPLGHELCQRCGTKLLLMAPAPTDAGVIGHSLEEHLLERISILEYSLVRTTERVERIIDLVERIAENASYDHNFVQSLTALLSSKGVVDQDEVSLAVKSRLSRQISQASEREQLETLKQTSQAAFQGRRPELFARLLETGIAALRDSDKDEGSRTLEKALKLDPNNSALGLFLGQFYFRTAKLAQARRHLMTVLRTTPEDYTAALLLGLLAADEGKNVQAEEYLRIALQSKKDSYAAHYGLGRVMIEKGQIESALSHFKRALMLKPSPDLYYLVGRVYFEQGRIVSAERHWQRALALNPRYDAALYHLGLVYLQRNCLNKAREHFRAALELKPSEGRYKAALRARPNTVLKPFPVVGLKRGRVEPGTGGLIEALLEDLNLKGPAYADEGEPQR